MPWPILSDIPATTGRSATTDDVNAGHAVFVLQSDGNPVGNPIEIDLPQYAWHIDQESGAKTACVVMQAEEANSQRLIGAIDISDDAPMAGLFSEFQLLGTTLPNAAN